MRSPEMPSRRTAWIGMPPATDRKSTRLNSSHPSTSYAVFCLKKKNVKEMNYPGADAIVLGAQLECRHCGRAKLHGTTVPEPRLSEPVRARAGGGQGRSNLLSG